ncbi:MAG: methylmalonyl-CoA epimerase [Bdellovibrionales bacterium]|jgi:methylmalonyl-CoA/ethylmalonyl-CoA epimerase|nr:methylmalonyl-CoA epimerase [Bdellovibrionales bacterium]
MSLLDSDVLLDHIAIAVNDLDKSTQIFQDLGLSFGENREIVDDQSVITSFAKIGESSHLELLMPLNKQGPIQKFIDKNGPGIHHICFKVNDIMKTSNQLSKKGYTLIYDSPKKGANNKLVNFLHPKGTGGVLIELSQDK